MKAIHTKLVRDLLRMRGQAIAISLVMACGVATFVMSLSMLDSLSSTLNGYYDTNRFGQVFANLKRAPLNLADRVSSIPGVAHAQHRIVERVTLDMPGINEPAAGQIISIPEHVDDGLNLLHLRAGRYPEPNGTREILVSQRFAEAHALLPGSSVSAVMNGRLESLRVVGIALSPEYIYLIGPGSILPDNLRFGVFWMGRDAMEAAFDMDGAFNSLVISTAPHANIQDVIDNVDTLIKPYGGLGSYDRIDQMSHKFIDNELNELRNMSMIVPVIFLGVAAFLLNIVVTRMIATQREQIAALKALGYSKRDIGIHYLGFVMGITGTAVILGTGIGALMGRGMTALYTEFFDFPTFDYTLHPRVIVLGFIVSTGAALFGVTRALARAMKLPPAEAMRPEAPPSFHPTILEKLGLHKLVPATIRMILRQLERHFIKTSLAVLGIALATAIVVVGRYAEDAVDYFMEFQFSRVLQHDIDVAFTDRINDSALSTLAHMPGVQRVEPYRTLAVRVRSGHVERRIAIRGLTHDDQLYQLLDMRGFPVQLPQRGIILSSILAERLDVRPGDTVRIEAMEGRRPEFDVQVSGVLDDFTGLSAYMHIDALNEHMNEQHTMNGAFIIADDRQTDALYTELSNAPRVAAVNVKAATRQSFEETIAHNMELMRPFLITFSMIIACGVVYNSARISLSERSRDLATLRVLGFTRREISIIQLGELAIITGIAIPIGLVLGYTLAYLISVASASELFRIPFVIEPPTFGLAAIVVLGATIASGMIVRRRLDRLDLIGVLKSRES